MSKRGTKPDFTDENIGVNPFVANLEIRVNKGYRKAVVDNEILKEEFSWEYDPCTKIFEIKGYKTHMAGLPIRSKEMLLWIMHSLEGGNDWIWINRSDYMRRNGVNSVNTYSKSLAVLCEMGFLAKHKRTDVYFINPQIFFKGNRIKKYSDKIKIMNNK